MLKRNRKLSKRGFSLIELMVAVAILAMVSFGIFKAYNTSFQVMADAKDRTVAINYAQERMEFIKNNTSLININYHFENTPDEEGKYNLVVDVTSDPTDITLNRVTTNVSWQNRDGENKEVELEMLIYNPDTSGAPMDPAVTSIVLYTYPEDPICCETAVIKAEVYVGATLVDYSVMVTFYTTTGTLSYQDAFTYNGIATVNLNNLTSENSTAIVTGMVGALSDTVTVISIPPVLLLTADPEVIFSGKTSTITATLTGKGNAMSGKPIEFSITSGGGILNDDTTTASSVTDADGKATVELSNTTEGEIIIEAIYCKVSATTTVTCNALIIEVSASNDYVSPGGTSTITATLTDSSGNPVEGETIEFSGVYSENPWTLTIIDGVTNENGIATAELSAAQLGTATVKAAYGSLTDTVTVICTTFVLEVNASDKLIAPGGTSTITATLTDSSGNPVEGETIEFSADYSGNLWGFDVNDLGVTDEYGIVTAELFDAQVGTATVTGTYGSTSDDAVVTCSTLNIVVNTAEDTVVPGELCTITATLTDNEIPVEGATITFYTTCGTWDSTTENPTNAFTLSDGEAQVDLIFSEGDEGKTATITVTYIISADPLLEISDTTTVTCKMKKDFKVIHGNSVIQSVNRILTLTNGVDYTLEPGVTTEDCFVRIVNTRITGIGRTSGGGTQNLDDYTVQISNPGNILTSFNFERVGSTNNCRVTWEIIQYIGAEGGANEIKVRTAVGGLSTTAISVNGTSLSNISNINKAVIYITGQSGSNTGRGEWNECLFTAEFIANGSNWIPRFSRGRAIDIGRVSYAVVEFTGSNWRNIQRVTFNSCNSTVPIPVSLLDTTKTFLHCQYTYVKSGNSGLDDSGETVEVLSTTQLRNRRTTSTDAYLKHHVVWVIENTQSNGNYMIVQHISGTRTDNVAPEEHVWSEAINEVRALDEASIQGETLASSRSLLTDTAYPIGSEGLVITSTTNLDRIQSDMGEDCYYAHCIVQLPTEE